MRFLHVRAFFGTISSLNPLKILLMISAQLHGYAVRALL